MKVRLTRHALERLVEMGVDEEAVQETARRPKVTYLGQHQSPPETIAIGDDIAVAYVDRGSKRVILTVLWACQVFERAS